MSFHFGLEKLMNHRKNLQDEASKNYLNSQAEYQKQNQILHQYYMDIETARKNGFEIQLSGGKNSAESLCQINDYIKGTEFKIEQQRQVVRRCLEKVEEMQELLREASIEYKIMEKLKEKKKEEFKEVEKKKEIKELDEMVTSRIKKSEK